MGVRLIMLLLFLSIIGFFVYDRRVSKKRGSSPVYDEARGGFILVAGVALLILVMIGMGTKAISNHKYRDHRYEREAIAASIEAGICKPTVCIIDEVTTFNKNVERNRAIQNNWWFKGYIADTYRDIEPVPMERLNGMDHTGHAYRILTEEG